MKENKKSNWPTLKGRLNQPLTSELEALKQLKTMIPLSKYGQKRLKELQKHIPQNYYKCVGCGNCVNADLNRGSCEICGGKKWIACTD